MLFWYQILLFPSIMAIWLRIFYTSNIYYIIHFWHSCIAKALLFHIRERFSMKSWLSQIWCLYFLKCMDIFSQIGKCHNKLNSTGANCILFETKFTISPLSHSTPSTSLLYLNISIIRCSDRSFQLQHMYLHAQS